MPLPTSKKVISCRWLFAVKFNPNGSVARLKACLITKGYAQTYGVDYLFFYLFLLLLLMIRTCIGLISGMSFYMEIFRKKFTWSNLRGLLLMRR